MVALSLLLTPLFLGSVFGANVRAKRQSTCASDLDITPLNWINHDVDSAFDAWWSSSAHDPSQPIPNQLAAQFDGIYDFNCGIDQISTCTIQGCQSKRAKLMIPNNVKYWLAVAKISTRHGPYSLSMPWLTSTASSMKYM
jgi:hypothetical protein